MQLEHLKDILSVPWTEKLANFVQSKDFDSITDFVKSERAKGIKIVPRTDRIFTALNKCPPEKVKVIMGLQDPYNTIEPDGLAMSCSLTGKLQPSLREVYREIRRTVSPEDWGLLSVTQNPDLSGWAEQGVLLINMALTVEWHRPNSHQGKWDKFIDAVFEQINPPYPLVYIMLGKEAQKFTRYARFGDYILTAVHPAASSYSGGVWDCQDIFRRCNRYLELHEIEPIRW